LNFEFLILDFRFWILDFGFWILDYYGFLILNFEFCILDFVFWILDFILDFGLGIWDFMSDFREQISDFREQDLAALPATLKSQSRMVNFWIFCAFDAASSEKGVWRSGVWGAGLSLTYDRLWVMETMDNWTVLDVWTNDRIVLVF